MTLCELYHRMQGDLMFLVKQEDRRAFLSVFAAGFDEEGRPILLAPHQKQLLKCLGCEHCNKPECRRCKDFPVEDG